MITSTTAGGTARQLPLVATLNSRQLANGRTIVRILRQAGLPDNAIAGALANAWWESGTPHPVDGARGWNERAVGDGGASVGVWQMHERGAGSGMSVAERQNVANATAEMVSREISKAAGLRFRDAAAQGASVVELAVIFGRDIERPADRSTATLTRERGGAAERLFGSGVNQGGAVLLPPELTR